ncbi:MAG TPA: sulfotransferase, partial [Actinomycetota bacterium]|nr:sulfotransferase [Actinomycetota bacterium]
MGVQRGTEPDPSRPENRTGSLDAGPSSKLPTFLLIGAMKAGTTSLYHYLRGHPQVFMPEVKEVMFFDPRHNWHRGIEWYEAQFGGAEARHLARGEASTSYTKFPVVQGVPARIASVLPDVRLLYVVRHPVERMQSHYLYLLSRGKESRPIERAFAEEPMYLDTSRYALQLEQYEPYIRPEQLLLIDSRDLRDRRVETLGGIFAFLGVDATWVPPTVDREFFRSADRRMRPALSRAVRRLPGLSAAARRAPRPLR